MIKFSNQQFELTEEHIESFYREGYFMAPSFISEQAVFNINAAYDAEMKTLEGERKWQSLPFAQEAQQELQTERVAAMMERLLGGPIQLWLGMYAVVMPGGKGLEWHQDNQYTHILGHMCNAFVALDDINTENAGLWIAPRSHRLGRQPNLNEGEGHRRAATPENAMSVPPMKRGDAVIFHRETLHHSKVNKTDKPRRAFAFQVSAANCRFAETGKLVEERDQ
ncbi:phytanoyl-CoA dioxygenase family protein [Rubellicoccus peritrichatus]|uniref:Phytanoyl-CoA dioxygenase family protein n=1 Tax=Rubellicoccus peritrichatus TaxID=3080537 RepID=A0AAQ3QV69_9BACT|nr:phytanoyl-CoA dioxygenase family protein [Puniceicoccus sp. CR14]WOO40592.1 phytanoyl-CoA dioxygenase family protein [Puniceicoccus sp. CR14]